ncbi:hypothetical protein [Engelhardtia mirabilis]|uniref:Uncharacterized protein n=1 Tax=Engelhardtia mirabilis TaxID=2528011 RepID=A0A518BS74_9BACT|nr:hypothetical protein Pla133_49420 [Planctomycetes bacterium Pla133]QDV04146.1 hypothetical protein Pla86_49400 [Planctomycetes bacterium Pla86]
MLSVALTLPLFAATFAPIDVFPGDPAALQNAIDAAAPGATILVHGGTYDPIVLSKAINIVASPKAFLQITPICPFTTSSKPIISLSGPGSGRATINNFGVSGGVDGFFYCNGPEPLIVGGGFDEFWIVDSVIGATWFGLTGQAPGAPAIQTNVGTLVISGSTISPIDADTDFYPGPPSPVGISAPGSTVIVTHSSVRGGSYFAFESPHCPGPPTSGSSGTGIVCKLLFQTGSEVTGGPAVTWTCGGFPQGTLPAGPAYDANLATDIFANLTPLNSTVRGTNWQLQAITTGAGGFLFVNYDTDDVEFKPGLGWDFLTVAETFLTQVVAPGTSTLSFPIPDVVDLVGFELGLELLDFNLSLFGGPVITQIR